MNGVIELLGIAVYLGSVILLFVTLSELSTDFTEITCTQSYFPFVVVGATFLISQTLYKIIRFIFYSDYIDACKQQNKIQQILPYTISDTISNNSGNSDNSDMLGRHKLPRFSVWMYKEHNTIYRIEYCVFFPVGLGALVLDILSQISNTCTIDTYVLNYSYLIFFEILFGIYLIHKIIDTCIVCKYVCSKN